MCLALAISLHITVPAQEKPASISQSADAAPKAAATWLGLIDSGQYSQSWTTASSTFRKDVDEDKWDKTIQAVLHTLGKPSNRKLEKTAATKTLPGSPDGNYIVVTYQTNFTNKKAATETVALVLDSDQNWRVSGYVIK
jgi:hypothetical protein